MSTLRRPNGGRPRKPTTHTYRPTRTPGGDWCTHPISYTHACGKPEHDPVHTPPEPPCPTAA